MAKERIESYQQLRVWQLAVDLSVELYDLTSSFPRIEQYGLTSQIRRSAVSVPANIAEGWGRGRDSEFAHFLRIARGSLKELETLILIAERAEMLLQERKEPLLEQTDHIGRMLTKLIASLDGPIGQVRERVAPYAADTVGLSRELVLDSDEY
ncbi:MAG: four helix bundle protein [Fimbriimonadaceae bacterium]|nr:four helix bundle protein [Fimbriimonadaceae bacterium]